VAVVVAFAAATLLGLLALWSSARAAVTICVIEVAGGRARIQKGSLSQKVLGDVQEIVRRPKVKVGTLRIVRAKDFAKLDARGTFSAEQLQQLRNVIGNVPVAKLAGGRAQGRA